MLGKKVKIINNNKFRVGLKLMDGVREVVVHPNSFVTLDSDDVFFLNNMCTLFQRKILIVEDDEINEQIGLKVEDKGNDIFSFNNEQIKELLGGNFLKMKKELGDVKEKHIIDRIVEVAKGMEDLAQGKIKFLSDISGYDLDQLMQKNDDN